MASAPRITFIDSYALFYSSAHEERVYCNPIAPLVGNGQNTGIVRHSMVTRKNALTHYLLML